MIVLYIYCMQCMVMAMVMVIPICIALHFLHILVYVRVL